MKNWVKRTLLASKALRLAGDLRASSAAILMYHSVMANPAEHVDSLGGIIHSEAEFRSQMELLARDYHPISLDRAVTQPSDGNALPKRSVVVTFDDGYSDNFEVALPILNHFTVPATFYVTVDCVEKRRLPWPSRLRFAFRRTNLKAWTDSLAQTWNLDKPADREKVFLATCDVCCQLSGEAQEEFVRSVERQLQISLPPESGALMMTYDQVRGIAGQGHMVGSHTMTHPNMGYVKEDEAHHELTESKRRLEAQLNKPVKHFSYPCPALSPHWNERTVEQSRAAGYETAVTTNSGLTRPGDNPLCLKRIHPTKTADGLRWNLESAFAGRAI